MGLWKTRHQSMEWLAKDFKSQANAIEGAFEFIDECIELFDSKSNSDDYCRICGLTLAKARNYALGAYGLILDGLGQEAGALIRPFIEYHELLVYFRKDPSRVQQAIDGRLPSAGNIAKKIDGDFQGFRQYLNDNASHSSYSHHSLSHLLDKEEMTIRKEQPFLENVLFTNMADFFVQLILLAIEAVNSLHSHQAGVVNKQAQAIDRLREEGISIFKLEERVPRP